MRAMILAAGRGERLRPLTDKLPKPLVDIAGKPLIEYHLDALARAGFREIVINQGHLGRFTPGTLGERRSLGCHIFTGRTNSPKPWKPAAEFFRPCPCWVPRPSWSINGDVWTNYPFARLRAVKCDWAHLVMVPNPPHNPDGDFSLVSRTHPQCGHAKN